MLTLIRRSHNEPFATVLGNPSIAETVVEGRAVDLFYGTSLTDIHHWIDSASRCAYRIALKAALIDALRYGTISYASFLF